MKKNLPKIICAILCIMMVCTAGISFASDLTLPVKMQRQMQHDGNGVKGTIRITGNAEADKHPLIYAIQNAEYSILRNMSGEDQHVTVFQTDGQDQQINKTEMYQNATGIFLRSDFLPERIYRLPDTAGLIPAGLRGTGENPEIVSVILSMANMTDAEKSKWDAVTAKYESVLETWLAKFAAAPELQRSADGTVLMNLIYSVPADDLRSGIADIIKATAVDPDVMELLGSRMTEEQKAVYLNTGLAGYYEEALKNLSLAGDLKFVKTVTTMGETISSELTMPLDPGMTGYTALTVASRDGQTALTLQGENETLQAIIPDGMTDILTAQTYEGKARILYLSTDETKKSSNISLLVSIRKSTEQYNDEESGKDHDIQRYSIRAERDTENLPEGVNDEDIPAFETIEANLELHYSGKTGPNAPTTLECAASFTQGDFGVQIEGKIKTAATWPFIPFSTDNAAVPDISSAELAADLATWIQNAADGIIRSESTGGGTEE